MESSTAEQAVMGRVGGRGPRRRRVSGLAEAARPWQWIKNLACLAGLIFSRHLFDRAAEAAAGLAFVGFCLASSAVYLVNDVFDRESDASDPKKRRRPVASGLVPASWAVAAAAMLATIAVGSSMLLPRACGWLLGAYLALMLAYSARLKQTVLVDVMIIAMGFVIRVLYGVYAVRAEPTPWVVLCMFFLALFLGFAKRRSELSKQADPGSPQRLVLKKYRIDLLDQLLNMTATLTITCYALYTVLGRPGGETLVVTVPMVVYGVYRYLLRVVIYDAGDAPDRDLLDDPMLVVTVLAWALACVAIIYGDIRVIRFVPAGGASG